LKPSETLPFFLMHLTFSLHSMMQYCIQLAPNFVVTCSFITTMLRAIDTFLDVNTKENEFTYLVKKNKRARV